MKIACAEWNLHVELIEGKVKVLLIENSTFLIDFIKDLYNQSKGEEGRLMFFEKDESIAFVKKGELIINPFSLDFCSRKIQSKLMQELNAIALDQCASETTVIRTGIINYLESLIDHMPYDIGFEENFEITGLLKFMGAKLTYEEQSFVDRICSYMKIMQQLCGTTLFIFVNLSQFLVVDQMRELEKEIAYMGIWVLLIESKIENEFHNLIIVDKDLCVIQSE